MTSSSAGGTRRLRIDDEDAVEPLVNVALQRNRVAVIEMQAERLGVELVDELAARHHLMFGQRPVHLRRMPAVEMNRVRVRALIQERDANAVAFGRADRRARHLAVERPRRKEDARRDLDLAIDGDDAGIRAAACRRAAASRGSSGRAPRAADPRSSRREGRSTG